MFLLLPLLCMHGDGRERYADDQQQQTPTSHLYVRARDLWFSAFSDDVTAKKSAKSSSGGKGPLHYQPS